MENATKSTWITNSKRFALEAESFEKKGAIFLRLVTEIADLHKESSDYEQERIESKHSLARRMSNFKSLMSEIQSRLQNDNWLSPHHDIQRQLEQFEEKMTAFKLSMRNDFDVMECTSRDIEGDIIQLAKHIDNWSKEGPNYSIPLADVDQDDLRDGDSKRQKDRCKNDIERRARVGAIDRRVSSLVFSSPRTLLAEVIASFSRNSSQASRKTMAGTHVTTMRLFEFGIKFLT